jgi:hypothetical protein
MSTTKRKAVATTQKTTESMTHADWDVQFNYETVGSEKPQSVSVQGTKKDANGASVYVAKTNSQVNVVFNNTPFEADLVTALVKELDEIMPASTR